MKISNNTIGIRTRDLPTCNAVPQPTALPRAPISASSWFYYKKFVTMHGHVIFKFCKCFRKMGTQRQNALAVSRI